MNSQRLTHKNIYLGNTYLPQIRFKISLYATCLNENTQTLNNNISNVICEALIYFFPK